MVDYFTLKNQDFFDNPDTQIKVVIHKFEGLIEYHKHTFYEFVFVERGFSTHFFNNRNSLLTYGDLFGTKPGDIHSFLYSKDIVLYNCIFSPEVIANELEELIKLPGLCNILDESNNSRWQRIHADPKNRKEIISILEHMIYEDKYRETGWELKLKSLLISFLVAFSRAFEKKHYDESTAEYKYVQYIYKALDYIDSNYIHPLQIDDISNHTGLSSDYFSRMFKQFTGLTPIEYMKNVRLAKAVELLCQPGGKSVSQIALDVGFDDPSYFSRQFKETLGFTPTEYKKQNISE